MLLQLMVNPCGCGCIHGKEMWSAELISHRQLKGYMKLFAKFLDCSMLYPEM